MIIYILGERDRERERERERERDVAVVVVAASGGALVEECIAACLAEG